MLKAYKFGPWEPDLAKNGTDRLTVCVNAYPIANGYAPVKSFGAITPALAASFKGGGAFVASDGTSNLLAGTASNLYRYTGSAWSSILSGRTATRWGLAQFGDYVVAVDGGAPVDVDLTAGTAAALAGSPPTADLVATVRDFVVLGRTGGSILDIDWSGFNDRTGWTGGVNQSGSQRMLDGGEIMGLAGGEYGLILQRNAIKRMTYVGVPLVFQFDEIAQGVGVGPMAMGSVAQWGRLVFYLSERGFMLTDGAEVKPIGNEKFNRWFLDRFSREDIEDNLTAAVDPQRSLVTWAMPGIPGVVLAYNWTLDRATTFELGISAVFSGFTANIGLDSLDAIYGNLDAMTISTDDPALAGGNPLLLVVDENAVVGALSGDNLEATFGLPNVEPVPGFRTRVRAVRPVTDATDVGVTIDARQKVGDAENIITASSMRNNGEMPTRANGRYLGITQTIAASAAWTFAQGIEVFGERAGMR